MNDNKLLSLVKRLGHKILKISKNIWAYISKGIKAIGSFFSKAATSFVGLFKKDDHSEQEQTQVFTAVEDTGSVKKERLFAGTKDQRTQELPHISKEHLSGEGKEHINMFTPSRRNSSFVFGVVLTSFKLLLVVIFMIGAAGLGTLVGVSKAYMETTPTLDTGKIQEQSETSYIYASNGQLITPYTGIENRDWATIDEIPKMLQDAVVAIEDVRFFNHTGVDVKRLIGAFLNNLMNSSVQGGSTLTQQLIKNRLLSFERTYKRKIQEAYLALQLEQEYSKDEILEAYMNTIHLGESNYGVKAAAKDYFNKELDQLTLRECAMLAGITRYPYMYSPRRCYYKVEDPSIINKRTDNVLTQMYKAGSITQQEYFDAVNDTVHVEEESKVREMYKYPHFVEYAVYDVITHMLNQRNLQDNSQNRAIIENELRTNGYHIYTTIDTNIQEIVQRSLEEWDDYPRLQNPENSVIKYKDGTEVIQPQAAAVIIEQSTGKIKALVGSRNTPTTKKTFNRAYKNTMPVGSSIKPLAVYAPAIEKGYSDGTVIPNLPLPIDGWDSSKGYPVGGSKYYGPVTLRKGLVKSLNSATAWTLLNLVGMQDSKNFLIDMGINPAHIKETGSGLALGATAITPLEMAGAFATIANSGVYYEPLSFDRVEDKHGNVILDAKSIREERRVFKESTAWLVTDMLVNAVQSGTGTRAKIKDMTIGGKTGTNQDVKGVFFAGISPYYTATLWIGHDRYEPLYRKVTASSSAAPLWQYFMSQVLEGLPDKKIIDADPRDLGLVSRKICPVSGDLATDACKLDIGEQEPVNAWFVKGTQPTQDCQLHKEYPVCLASGKIASVNCPQEEGNVVMQGLLFLPEDSIYWQLTQAKRDEYLPGAFHTLEDMSVYDLTPDMPNYYDYFCNIHTEEWAQQQALRAAAIEAAKEQVSRSNAVLADPTLAMSTEHQQQLKSKIQELQVLIADPAATTAAIEQKTSELKSLTEQLKELYKPQPTPKPTPEPPEPTPNPETPEQP